MSSAASHMESIFFAALEIPEAEARASYVAGACGQDDELRERVMQMLAVQSKVGNFMEHPAAAFAGTVHLEKEILDSGLSAAFGPNQAVVIGSGNHSVLKSLGRTLAEVPRVLLRDAKESGEDPIVRPRSKEIPADHADSRYQLAGEIARGGMGAIIKGRDIDLGRDLAIKVLLDAHKDKPEVVQRFIEEAQIGGQLQHPGIVPVYELGQFGDQRPFFSMKLVKGETLAGLLSARTNPAEDRAKFLGIFEQVCQTMAYAHSRGVIHRDLKPANIMVGAFGEVQVMDWGLAKVLEAGGIADEKKSLEKQTDVSVIQTRRSLGSDSPGALGSVGSQTQMGSVMGTPAYMSPEQALGEVDRLDERTDVFGLGAILCEILTGKPPHVAASGEQVFRLACRGKLDDCYARLNEARVDAELLQIVRESLAVEPDDRLRDASALSRRISTYLQSVDHRMRQAELNRHQAVTRTEELHKRQKVMLALAVSLLVGAVASAWFAFHAREQRNLAQIARLDAEESNEAEISQRQKAEMAGQSERQQRLQAQLAQRVAEDERERANAQAQKASVSEERSRRLLYAADMNLAQQSLRQNNLGKARRLLDRHRPQPGEVDLRGWEWRYLWQLTKSNSLVTLGSRPTTRGFSVSFSPTGNRLAVGWFDGRVDLWDVPSQKLLQELTVPELTVPAQRYTSPGRVAFSPSGNTLAATTSNNSVMLHDLNSDQKTILWNAPEQGNWNVRDIAFSQDGAKVAVYAGSSPQTGDAVWVVNVASHAVEARFPTSYSFSTHFAGVRFSRDGQRLYFSNSDYQNRRCSIECMELATGQELWRTEPVHDLGLSSLDISPDGQTLVSASGFDDPTIRVWDAETGRLRVQLYGHTSWVCKLSFTSGGRSLISAAADQSIRVWDTSSWTEVRVLRGHSDEVHAVAFAEQIGLVASTSKDGELMLWEYDGKSAADGYYRLSEAIEDSDVTPMDGSRVLLLPRDKAPELIDLANRSVPLSLTEIGSSADVRGVEGNTVCHWDRPKQIIVSEMRNSEWVQLGAVSLESETHATTVAYNPQRQLLAYADWPATESVSLRSITPPVRRIDLESDVSNLNGFRFSNDGNYLLAWSAKRDAWRVWNVETTEVVVSINEQVTAAAFAGPILVISININRDHEVRFYDLTNPNQKPKCVTGRYPTGIGGLAATPDGSLVALADDGGLIRIFDPVKGELIVSLHGHLNGAFGVAFSPDGQRLISSCGGVETLKLWDVVTWQELLTLRGIGSFLRVAKWNADSELILTGAPWQAWRAPTWQQIVAAEESRAEVEAVNLNREQPSVQTE